MKKRGVFILFLFLILSIYLVSAASNSTTQTPVDKAYKCLTDKVSAANCSSLTTEEKTFSLLAINQCQPQLISDSKNSGQCWPGSSCSIKATAQAILALHNSGANTQQAQDWLNSKNATPTSLVWYLEIDSSNATSCSIQYSGNSYQINIYDNKQLSSGAGNCLALTPDNYFLTVSPSCYNKNFTISCSSNFLTSTLFRKSTSSTIYVSDQSSSAVAGGTTNEKVSSSCFSTTRTCDYEGTLWASLVLNTVGEDVSAYIPYLITLEDENQKFLPDSFLYAITAKKQYEVSLLSQQQSNQWWSVSGDKFYDTALALYPLQSETPQEKTNAQNWLLNSQDSAGCWQGNIRDTAFILASSWPKTFSGSGGGGTGLPDCTTAGYFCTLPSSCTGQDLSSKYNCNSISICCSTQPANQTCLQEGGTICSSNERCIGGTIIGASDATSSQLCCSGGTCTTPQPVSECEQNNGICRSGGCASTEQTGTYSCTISGDTCCIPGSTNGGSTNNGSTQNSGGSSLWIWILLILIVLVAIGIIFRNKLRMFFSGISLGGKPKPSGPGGPGQFQRRPMYYPPMRPMQRTPERRILPPSSQPQRRPPSKSQSELDEVLRKLKEMGK